MLAFFHSQFTKVVSLVLPVSFLPFSVLLIKGKYFDIMALEGIVVGDSWEASQYDYLKMNTI